MGCINVAPHDLWQEYAPEFPVRQELVYLNHAAVAPLCRRASDAMKSFAEEACRVGSLYYSTWMDCYEGLRVAAATMIQAHRDEIAIVKNTSEGIATVALGFPWRSGDKVVVFNEEFPANQYIWRRLQEKGVLLDWLPVTAPLERVDEACRGARLLAVSFVQYLSGHRIDLNAFGEICRRHGVFFFVDAIQGLGAFPVDVRAAHISALAADGHKWLLGPEGNGILYVNREWLDRIEPVEFGWTTVANYADYSSRDMTPRQDAGRFECGTLNTIGCFGLRAAFEFLLEVGVERVAVQVQKLGDLIAEGAKEKGYEILGERSSENGAGIVCLRKPGMDSRAVHAALRERKFITAPRQGWVRVSPHFYIAPGEIEAMIDALP